MESCALVSTGGSRLLRVSLAKHIATDKRPACRLEIINLLRQAAEMADSSGVKKRTRENSRFRGRLRARDPGAGVRIDRGLPCRS